MTPPCPLCALAPTHRIRARSEHFVAFDDVRPQHPVHVVVAPRVHASTLAELLLLDRTAALELVPFALDVAQQLGLAGHRIVINSGRSGGQRVLHAHAHLLSKG